MTLPAKSQTNILSQKIYLIGCGIGGIIAVIILVITMAFPGSTVTSDNSILVDPTKRKAKSFCYSSCYDTKYRKSTFNKYYN